MNQFPHRDDIVPHWAEEPGSGVDFPFAARAKFGPYRGTDRAFHSWTGFKPQNRRL